MIIAVVSPETVMYRLNQREKQDRAIFEEINFQRKLEQRYNSQWLKNLFENHGSKVVYINTNFPKTKEDTEKETLKIWAEFIEDKFKEL
jgi:thymidylate kinase